MRPRFGRLTGALRDAQPDPYYIDQKRLELEWLGERLWFCLPETEPVLSRVAEHIGVRPGTIVDMGLQISEDIVVMHHGRMKAAFFAFPSGWSPDEKRDMTLTEIHGPVADGAELRQASERISTIMHGGGGPWSRYVWTIAGSEALSIHPDYPRPEPETMDDLWFRYEYQTFDTVIPGETSVFLVKTVTVPLLQYADTDHKQAVIQRVINSMTDDVLTYKGLHKSREILNRYRRLI
jgi:hypothetical protein